MKGNGSASMVVLLTAAVIAVILSGCATLSGPAPRPGPLAQGSARWAYAIAQPSIAGFPPDVQLYTIIGGFVYRDGRLPSNTGDWSVVTWSPSLKQVFQVTVKFDGTFFTTTRNENAPPSQNGQPLPQGWADSTDVFAVVAPHLGCGGISHAQVAVLNVASYAEAPNQPVWGINFNVGQNQLVKWDGTYVGPQGAPDVPCAASLKSEFLKTDACANLVMAGTPYDMNDPAWRLPHGDQNRDVCAYKFFSALHMLGYQTNIDGSMFEDQQLRALEKFQRNRTLPITSVLDRTALQTMDALLVTREAQIAPIASAFPLYARMKALHPNDVSQDWVAYLFNIPMTVLPQRLHMTALETLQCINIQCLGDIVDAAGNSLGVQRRIDPVMPHFFVGGDFNRDFPKDYRYSAAVYVETVLHEFAHYVDGVVRQPQADLPVHGSVNTRGFYDTSYDMAQFTSASGCAPKRSTNPKDWISRYGFLGATTSFCPTGKADPYEEWADAFSIYVTAGKTFRAAALQNATIHQKYDWLKLNVFNGIEYDTDLAQPLHTGCVDVAGAPPQQQPSYTSCSESYVWDAELRIK